MPKTKIHSFYKRKFPGFPVIHGAKPFPLIIQPQKASKFFSWQWQMEKNCKQKKSFFFLKDIINPSFIDSGVRIEMQCKSFVDWHINIIFRNCYVFSHYYFPPLMIAVESRCGKKIELRVCLLGNSNDVQVIYFKISPACRFFRSQL